MWAHCWYKRWEAFSTILWSFPNLIPHYFLSISLALIVHPPSLLICAQYSYCTATHNWHNIRVDWYTIAHCFCQEVHVVSSLCWAVSTKLFTSFHFHQVMHLQYITTFRRAQQYSQNTSTWPPGPSSPLLTLQSAIHRPIQHHWHLQPPLSPPWKAVGGTAPDCGNTICSSNIHVDCYTTGSGYVNHWIWSWT